MSVRELLGVLLVDGRTTSVRGVCNHTRRPVAGSILVVEALGPDLYDTIVASAAVICGDGGRTGHMESLCRSRGIPVLRVDRRELAGLTGQVTVRTDRESVVLGDVDLPARSRRSSAVTPADLGSICVVIADATDVETTNALAPRVEQVTSFFVREEFVCLSAGLSPLDALRSGSLEADRYGAAIGAELCGIVKELLPGQRLVMRLLDLRSDDAERITTRVTVRRENNPDLGLHGARALLKERGYPRAFAALRDHVADRLGPDAEKIGFAVPFINDHYEYLRLRLHLDLADDLPLAVFVETPAAVHSVPEFCAAGASELFVGTKDLVQFYLAADRGNHLVAGAYQTRHPAVLAGLGQAVGSARQAGTPVHVYSLLADMDHYVRALPADGFMMCTAELRSLAQQDVRGAEAA
ncbi:putative PEP-binding protein [Actinophytocola algeriensis]|uniref:Phosphoenolpyruvate-protein kinase (PTS system EI component) n=1 Tax=Actinophytocola algeriensis TaxID=1768010 RepID=A0A7W7QDK8_9PSEU|nr:putative PEP-binding protein [Actinophytocola algeriensis]MBB4911620.1 phosphoenolpyruvate-protein kinase (PTS system EI component) [Actinophytocola algeriensis]MBE1473392.1 phosphoenolpyruvate-protein kinase (PTS system EI component) [Actinophytocola algeriensis]